MVYSILILTKNEVNIKILQAEEFSFFPFCFYTLTVLVTVNGILQLITVVLITVI